MKKLKKRIAINTLILVLLLLIKWNLSNKKTITRLDNRSAPIAKVSKKDT